MPSVRVEALLRAAENGSVHDLARLFHEWPQNFGESKRALRIILGHLEVEFSFISQLTDGRRSREDVYRTIALVGACLSAFDGALKHIGDKATPAQCGEMFSILMPHLPTVVAWIALMARASPWIEPEYRASAGPSIAAGRLCSLLTLGIEYVKEDNETLRTIVDLILWTWVQDDGPAPSTGRYKDFQKFRFQALLVCNNKACTRRIMREKLANSDARFHMQLATAFCRWCSDWAIAQRQQYEEDPTKVDCLVFSSTMVIVESLASVSGFSHAMCKAGFPVWAVKTALEFRDCPCSLFQDQFEPSQRGTLAAETTSLFLDIWLTDARHAHYLMPRLLEVGLLQTIVDDLQTLSKGRKTLMKWLDLNDDQPTPLQWIARDVTFHPNLVKSLLSAIDTALDATPEDVRREPIFSKHWNEFVKSIEVHRAALSGYRTKTLNLCDNLEATCQQKDWETIHKHECVEGRQRRIDLELKGGWLGYQTRLFNLCVLETLLAESTSNHSESPTAGKGEGVKKIVFVADLTKVPRQTSYESTEDVPSKEFYGVPAFSNIRSRALLRVYEEDSEDSETILACSLTGMGQFMIATMARYLVRRSGEVEGQAAPLELVLLNGFIRVLDEPRANATANTDGSDLDTSTDED
ncbi:hypothetical protein NMY22_g16774 [Coprinellus aureogranulatus]|nr:hypothetical protein NMY22_g16774 [Coprinellus aureogranulatus]